MTIPLKIELKQNASSYQVARAAHWYYFSSNITNGHLLTTIEVINRKKSSLVSTLTSYQTCKGTEYQIILVAFGHFEPCFFFGETNTEVHEEYAVKNT